MPMYTPGQVSDMLHLPPSSLRRLSKEFSDFLEPQQSRRRNYSERDIDTLRRIREMTAHGLTIPNIRAALPAQEKKDPAPGDTLALVPTVSAELVRLDDVIRSMASRQADQEKTIEALRADQEKDRARLARLEAWAALPWWKRWFTPPPK